MSPEERFRQSCWLQRLADQQYDHDGDATAYAEAMLAAHRAGPSAGWLFDPSNDATIDRITREVEIAAFAPVPLGLLEALGVQEVAHDR